jgi:hypothetical protein
MVLLNRRTNKRVWVKLEDSEGDEVDLADIIDELVKYMKDKLDDEEGNQLTEKILPLMTQAVVSGLGRITDIRYTSILLSDPNIRMTLIYMMIISFIFYKMVQVKGLKINTLEEDVDDDEIDEIERKSEINRIINMSAMLGVDPKETIRKMIDNGDLTEDDLFNFTNETRDDDDGPDN